MIENITTVFNNRELASIIWALVLLVWVSMKSRDFWKSVWGLIQATMGAWKIFALMFSYIAICLLVLYELKIWDPGLTKITIFWLFGWAIVMLMNSSKAGKEKGYLKKILGEIVGLTVIISFISNFYSFSLLVELFLVPFVVLFAGMAALAPYKPEYKQVGTFSNRVLAVFGLGVLGISLYITLCNFGDFATIGTLQEFLVPIVLSLIFIPFIYVFSAYSRWEQKRVIERALAENQSRRP